MQITLKNFDSSFLHIIESFKSVMPKLEIIKEPCVYNTNEIKLRLQNEAEQIKSGDNSGYSLDEVRAMLK